jgi:acetyltransferase-like isoleucine patch superfamily enzyme
MRIQNTFKKVVYFIRKSCVIFFLRLGVPPRVLMYEPALNADILRAFGARIGKTDVHIYGPLVLHDGEKSYGNLTIGDHCRTGGNNYIDLTARVTLEDGVSLGAGAMIMSHNRYNHNAFLEERLAHTCGKKDVLVKKGAGIKAGAVVTMGVTIGADAVVAAGAVVNRDIPDRVFAAGVPAKVVKEII